MTMTGDYQSVHINRNFLLTVFIIISESPLYQDISLFELLDGKNPLSGNID